MKRLTINHIARANLKQNRRAYLSMAVGIFTAVFLAATLCLSVQGIAARQAEDKAEKFGRADIYTVNHDGMSDQEMLETGFFQPEIGHVYVTASVPETNVALGYYDEIAAPLMSRRVLEGRMPEAPGEIAIERSVLDRLRLEDMAVGDSLTLTVEAGYGVPEERTYTIVGFLNEQSTNLNLDTYTGNFFIGNLWPAILTNPGESDFATGYTIVHRLFTLRPFVTRHQVLSAFQWGGPYMYQDVKAVAQDYTTTRLTSEPYYVTPAYMLAGILNTLVLPLTCMLGVALLIAVCAGIAGIMESQLARKTEEIGMLRAVGATKRQIRRIFGREAWLLALTVSPVAIALALLFVWVMSRIAPSFLLFRPSAWVLLPVLLLVMLTILISSGLPLRRASRIMPMSVLRDTAILRKARRIKPRKSFNVPALVSRRHLTLHPTRLIGSVLLVAMMLVMTCLGSILGFMDVTGYMRNYPAFKISDDNYGVRFSSYAFVDYIPKQAVLNADLQQIAALPGVSKVMPHRELNVCYEADAIDRYLIYPHGWGEVNRHLATEEILAAYAAKEEKYKAWAAEQGVTWNAQAQEIYQMDHLGAQHALGTTRPLVNFKLVVLANELEDMNERVVAGRIDVEAINAGREVVLYTPDYYEYDSTQFGGLYDEGGKVYTSFYEGDDYTDRVSNETLTVGSVMPLVQFYVRDDVGMWDDLYTQEEYDAFYAGLDHRRADVTIGAEIKNIQWLHDSCYQPCIITSEEGLRNMGLFGEALEKAEIYLAGTPDAETEAWLETRIRSIASRGGMTVTNNLAYRREQEASQMSVIVVFVCIAVVFFAAAAGLICGNVSRQIRADSRMIGTLRAVGADDRALAGCYSGSIFISVGLGIALAVLMIMLLIPLGMFPAPGDQNFLPGVISSVCLAALMLGCCQWVLRLRVKDVIKKSIVENIKEL